MKLKDGVKCGLGFAIGWWIWHRLICTIVNSLWRIFFQSDYWKKAYESMSEDEKEIFKPFKPQDTKVEQKIKFGFQDSKSSGSE